MTNYKMQFYEALTDSDLNFLESIDNLLTEITEKNSQNITSKRRQSTQGNININIIYILIRSIKH